MTNQPILIAGGGIAGLATALGLSKLGHNVTVLERSAFDQETGAGIQLGPNASHALRHIGAYDAVRAIASSPPEIHVRDGHSGAILQRMKLGSTFEDRYGAPYLVALRADLHAALRDVASQSPRIQIWNDCEVTSAVDWGDGVKVNDTIDGRCLIAADGVHSRQRYAMFPETRTSALRYTIFRNLDTAPPDVTEIALDCVNLWLCRKGHIVHYFAGKQNKLNLVAVADGNVIHPYKSFPFVCPALAHVLGVRKDYTTWPALAAPSLPAWHRNNICLIGDAAHGTVPFLAQGGAMALEDAAAMANCFANSNSIPAAFECFFQQRSTRTAKLDKQSRRMGRIYHAKTPLSLARNLAIQSGAVGPLRTIDWIYAHKVVQ